MRRFPRAALGSTHRKEIVAMGSAGGTPAATIQVPEKICNGRRPAFWTAHSSGFAADIPRTLKIQEVS